MRFVRENLFYVILSAVVVVGLVAAVFYYTGSGISKNVKDRTRVSKDLVNLGRQRLKVDAGAVKAMQARIDALSGANEADLKECLEFNRRNLPVLKIPVGAASEVDAVPFDARRYQENALYIPYIKKYNQTLDQLISPAVLMSTTPPTAAQISKEVGDLTDEFKNEDPAKVQDKAKRSMMFQQANAGMIYAATSALDRVLPERSNFAAPEKLWGAQVNLWVTNEIIRAIVTTNQQWLAQQRQASGVDVAASVTNSAVRHLVKLEITEVVADAMRNLSSGRLSLTQRQDNVNYAVIPYRFKVVMPTRHIRTLVDVLEAQNYHTVTNIALSQVVDPEQAGYYYGIEPVMTVQFDGELLLMSDWVAELMPESIAKRFGKTGS